MTRPSTRALYSLFEHQSYDTYHRPSLLGSGALVAISPSKYDTFPLRLVFSLGKKKEQSSLVGPDVVFVLVRFPGSGPGREVAGVWDERGVRVREAHVEVAFAASDVAAVAPGEGRLRLEHLGRRARGIGGRGGGEGQRVASAWAPDAARRPPPRLPSSPETQDGVRDEAHEGEVALEPPDDERDDVRRERDRLERGVEVRVRPNGGRGHAASPLPATHRLFVFAILDGFHVLVPARAPGHVRPRDVRRVGGVRAERRHPERGERGGRRGGSLRERSAARGRCAGASAREGGEKPGASRGKNARHPGRRTADFS